MAAARACVVALDSATDIPNGLRLAFMLVTVSAVLSSGLVAPVVLVRLVTLSVMVPSPLPVVPNVMSLPVALDAATLVCGELCADHMHAHMVPANRMAAWQVTC